MNRVQTCALRCSLANRLSLNLTRPASRIAIRSSSTVAAAARQVEEQSSTTQQQQQDSFSSKLITYNHPTAPLASFNQRLAHKLRYRGNPRKTLEWVLEIIDEIKKQNLKFDLNTYNALLAVYMRVKDHAAILKTLRDMQQDGIKPTLDSYNVVLEAFGNSGLVRHQAQVLEAMEKNNVVPSVTTYHQLLRGFCKADMLEQALDLLERMKILSVKPKADCYTTLVGCCLRLRDWQTAFKLLKEAESTGMAVKGQPKLYMNVLRVTCQADQYEEAEYCWRKLMEYGMRPDEGTCLGVLRVAAKSGNPKLATDVIRQLSMSGYPYKEEYFSPLMESFVTKEDLKSAFNVLNIMRVSGVTPTARTTLAIRRYLGKNIERADMAYHLMEELKAEGKTVDVEAFNTVIDACAAAQDINRSIALYREAGNLGVTPNVETYNSVLKACVVLKAKGMGNVVIDDMKTAGVAPNLDTYSIMIQLCCTQKNYEDAFMYLEEMKGYGVVPPKACYDALIKKLAVEGDPRFHLALEEMETFGYPIDVETKDLWK